MKVQPLFINISLHNIREGEVNAPYEISTFKFENINEFKMGDAVSFLSLELSRLQSLVNMSNPPHKVLKIFNEFKSLADDELELFEKMCTSYALKVLKNDGSGRGNL